jgi:hypothetical protein
MGLPKQKTVSIVLGHNCSFCNSKIDYICIIKH